MFGDEKKRIINLSPIPLSDDVEFIVDSASSGTGKSKVSDVRDNMVSKGIVSLSGDFSSGFTATEKNQVFSYGGEWYRWDGALPKTVAASSTPATTGGVGSGAWVSVGDAALRSELDAGTASVGGKTAGSVANRTDVNPSISLPVASYGTASTFITIVLGDQTYSADTIGAGSVLIGGYTNANKNRLPNTQELRAIIGGYDNEITSDQGGSDGLASAIIVSHHSTINGGANHSTIVGGSYSTITQAAYAGIFGGTNITISGQSDASFATGRNNDVIGTAVSVFGENNDVTSTWGAVFGSGHNVGQSSNTLAALVAGQNNTVDKSYSAVFGFSNTVNAQYNFVSGRENVSSADYSVVTGRGAVCEMAFSQAHGFSTASESGVMQQVRYKLKRVTTDGNLSTMSALVGSALSQTLPSDGMVVLKAKVWGNDGTDAAVFDVEQSLLIVGGSATSVYSTQNTLGSTSGASTWAATFAAANNARVQVTGEVGKTINWFADVEILITKLN